MITNKFPNGSQWEKWDLHVHAPGTKLGGFSNLTSAETWDKFCQKIEESDVKVFGITDYWSCECYENFIKEHAKRYPHTSKDFFCNVEVRLSVSVNRKQEEVDLHFIFNPERTDVKKINEFLSNLKTNSTDSSSGRKIKASELGSRDDFEKSTTDIDKIQGAFSETFGEKSVRQDFLLMIVPGGNDGLRPESGVRRKEEISDEIDKTIDGIFSNSVSTREYYLKTDRLEEPNSFIPKRPVFSGSDAHSFEDIDNKLGKVYIERGTQQSNITWIKANPTFEGLIQTIEEPEERVYLGGRQPQEKDLDKVISKIKFSGNNDFPNEVVFNENMNSIIGGRSSGKSTLLTYLVYGIDERLAHEVHEDGPAAGYGWKDMEDSNLNIEVVWGHGEEQKGKVVYMPQNALFDIGNDETGDKLNNQILPLVRANTVFGDEYDSVNLSIEKNKQNIESSIDEWFKLEEQIRQARDEIRGIGDIDSLSNIKTKKVAEEKALRDQVSLSDEEANASELYQTQSQEIKEGLTEVESELNLLSPFIDSSNNEDIKGKISLRHRVQPEISSAPLKIQNIINPKISSSISNLENELNSDFKEYYEKVIGRQKTLNTEYEELKKTNASIIKKLESNDSLLKVSQERQQIETQIKNIELSLEKISEYENLKSKAEEVIKENIDNRLEVIQAFRNLFNKALIEVEKLSFSVEADFNPHIHERILGQINKNHSNPFMSKNEIEMTKVNNNPTDFLTALSKNGIKCNSGSDIVNVAKDVLTFHEDIRFVAELDGDKIGGFSPSTMTPGKRALFALIIELAKQQESWPLLIDQPEDDLDSRSIYEVVVPYLLEVKSKRQIILVSHDANIVIGADSEEIIVANRGGSDSPNENDRTFDYTSGAIEEIDFQRDEKYTLSSQSIRSHACSILDGGQEAFNKRRKKYHIAE